MAIGLFGGSFDPIHNGHLAVAHSVLAECELSQILFIPCWQQPYKAAHSASVADRQCMLELALANEDHFKLDTGELEAQKPSCTIDTVHRLQQTYPDDKLWWILGSDLLATLPSWHNSTHLLHDVTFIIVRRPGSLEEPPPPGMIYREIQTLEPLAIASSTIRTRCQRGEPITGLVPDTVANYITSQDLYSSAL